MSTFSLIWTAVPNPVSSVVPGSSSSSEVAEASPPSPPPLSEAPSGTGSSSCLGSRSKSFFQDLLDVTGSATLAVKA